MSAERLLARAVDSHAPGINRELEKSLNHVRVLGCFSCGPNEGTAQLIDEKGNRGIICSFLFAQHWTALNPEWRYEKL